MKEKLLSALEKSRNYTLQVAEAMPVQNYDFKPADAVWNFKELMHHLAYCTLWMDENYLQKKESAWNPPKLETDKKETIRYLYQVFDAVQKTISKMEKVNEEQITSFASILEHTAHHRGQATTYLRCAGITPPEYPF